MCCDNFISTPCRSRLAIIPQHAFLFSGSVRLNLDPWGKVSFCSCWLACHPVYISYTHLMRTGYLYIKKHKKQMQRKMRQTQQKNPQKLRQTEMKTDTEEDSKQGPYKPDQTDNFSGILDCSQSSIPLKIC